jgi:hypothetical protein
MTVHNHKYLPADAAASPSADTSSTDSGASQETRAEEPGYDAIRETFSSVDPLSPFATESDLATDHGDVESTSGQSSDIEQASSQPAEQIDPVAGGKPII